jgi:ubiquinone biosynthesis protein
MIRPSQALRLFHITLVLLRHGLDEVVLAAHLFRPLRFLGYLSPWYWARRRDPPPYPVRIRRALEDLGPIFVKFGQLLSTRRDLLPDELADELARLQDQVPPFPGATARIIIEKAYRCPVEDLLDEFQEHPLASASIAQVHTARLKDGRAVVVKVLRPGIEKIISRDVSLMYTVAGLAQRYWREGRRLRPLEVVREYEKTIFDELDLLREAANASQQRRNFLDSAILYIPDVHWELTRKNVMVMERISGIPVSDVAALKAQGLSLQELGERGVEIFFTQVFRDNFFHADMHPGNIFVEPSGRYISIDFGIMGSLTTEDQRYLAENLLAFFNRDYRRVAELHVESGWVSASTRIDEFESAIRTVSEPIWQKPLSEISFGHFLVSLFQTARRFNMEVQPQLVLLEKTLLNIEGLGRQLYPDLDLWSTAKPFLEDWMASQVGPRAFFGRLRATAPQLSEQLPQLPLLAYKLLKTVDQERALSIRQGQELQRINRDLQESNRKLMSTIAGAACVLAGSMLLATAAPASPPTWISAVSGLLLGLGVWLLAALLRQPPQPDK